MAGGVTGGRQILNQGTLGGSLAAALPHSDAPAVMVALGARAVIAGPGSERTVAVAELFAGAGRTVLESGEIIVRVDVPSSRGAGVGHHKLKHSGSSWPIAIAAALVRLRSDGRCAGATLTLGAVAATPVTVDVGPVLDGEIPDAAALAEAGRLAAAAVPEPWSDVLAPGDYRAAVIPVVTARALTMALDDARRPGNDDEGHDA
jgi:carbon-monoxide dehydrogenase medium subunit